VTVTHADMTRYFMSIPEACALVLGAAVRGRGGELFVLDMGEPVRIGELARNMIELSGLAVRNADNPAGDIEIVEIGLRPGEKLYEELLIGNNPAPTGHPRILKADELFMPIDELSEKLERLAQALAAGSRIELMAMLHELVPEFVSGGDLVDWVHLEGAGSFHPPHGGQLAASSA
jgi:FlaA1/EpsC-like NDP-sugar epimerase